MTQAETTYLDYQAVRKLQKAEALRQYEIPIGHAISLPMPTKRWGEPAYATFASPALRESGLPTEQGAPDRWWVINAQTSHLLLYARWKAQPYAEGVHWSTVTLPASNKSRVQLRESLKTLDLLMNTIGPAFFTDTPADETTRKALREGLWAAIPEVLLSQYRAFTPDFFAWLET